MNWCERAASRRRRAPRRRRRAVVSTTASARRRGGCATLAPAPPSTRRSRDGVGSRAHDPRTPSPPPRRESGWTRAVAVAGTASPRWRRGGLAVAMVPSDTHTHGRGRRARRRRAHTTHNTRRRRRASKQNHVPRTGSRTSSVIDIGARASSCPSKARSWTSSSTCPRNLYAGRAALSRGRRATWRN